MRLITANNCRLKDGRATRIGAKASTIGNVLVHVERPDDHDGIERHPVWPTPGQAARLQKQIGVALTKITRKARR